MSCAEREPVRPSELWLFLPVGAGIAIGLNAGSAWLRWSAGAAAAFSLAHILFQSWHYRQFMSGGGESNLFYFGMRFLLESLKVGLPAFITISIRGRSEVLPAKTPWPPAAKAGYVATCTREFEGQAQTLQQAHATCSCVADGLEREFGLEEYSQMVAAQPKQRGNSVERRLYSVLIGCQARPQ